MAGRRIGDSRGDATVATVNADRNPDSDPSSFISDL
jgi:hypothetical protein